MNDLIQQRIEQLERFLACWASIEVEEIDEEYRGFAHFKRGELYAIKDEISFLKSLLSEIK